MSEIDEKYPDDNEGFIDEEDSCVEYFDLAELSPIGDEETFMRLINKMVVDQAPRMFALCEEIGDRIDAATVAWGMSFHDSHTELVYGLDSRQTRITVVSSTAERARDFFAARSTKVGCTIRLVWVDQAQTHIMAT